MHKSREVEAGRDDHGHSSAPQPVQINPVAVHGIVWLIGLFGMPAMAPAQAGVLGVWLAWGRGSIWKRLVLSLAGWVLIAMSSVSIMAGGPILVSVTITTIFAATTCSGLGAVLLAQIHGGSRMPVRFRFWELVVGMAALGGAFALVGDRFDFRQIEIYRRADVARTLTVGLSMGTASGLIGLPLLLRRGAMRLLVSCVAWVVILVIPLVAVNFVDRRDINGGAMLTIYIYYLMNLGLVAYTLHSMDEHLWLADEDDQIPPEPGSEVPPEREPLDPPAPVGAGWGGQEETR